MLNILNSFIYLLPKHLKEIVAFGIKDKLWQADNEEWLKARKKEWLTVKPNIEEINLTSSKDMKGLRHFFIHGEALPDFEFPRMTQLKGGDTPLFFKLWFLPELEANLIKEEVNNSSVNDLICFNGDFFQEACVRNSTLQSDGLMAGREELICKVIYEGSFELYCKYSERRYSEEKYERYSSSFFGSFNRSIRGWFEDGYPVNNAYQWMIPVWKDCIQYLPERAYEPKNKGLRKLMKILSPDYHQPHFDTDDRYQRVATELREYILSDESPEALKEVWREVHEG